MTKECLILGFIFLEILIHGWVHAIMEKKTHNFEIISRK